MPKPTADWERVGDRFYRKVQLYTDVFDQDLELENYLVVGAPYSGAVAIYRDEAKIQSFRASQTAKSGIDIYSCAGKLIRRINWDKGVIKGLGWSLEEKLLVVTEDGTVRCYYDLQGDFVPFTLGHGAEEVGVKACRFWTSGFVALLNNNHLISVARYDEPRPKLLAIPPTDPVESWALIPPTETLSRSVEVLLAIGATMYVVDATDCEDRQLEQGPFGHTSVSPNGKYVALYTEDGKVWVVSSDFQNKLSEYDSRAKTVPKDMQWCGNSSVVLAWEDEIHVVGPNGVASKYYYDSWVHLISDVDGIRIMTNDLCEFLQRVPDVSEETFRLGSTSPAAVLLEAIDHLEKKSPKADDLIQMIRPNLSEAVDTCVRAAGNEFSIHWQKQLLKAASFGKSVIDLYNSDDFVDMCETLRVLNAVRFYEIGLPLSYDQYMRLTPDKLVERLTNRHEYQLALKISDYLRLPTDKIYVHWASQKVRVSNEDEETICRMIVDKLKGKQGVSFEEIARSAYDEGRARLATELLDHEPRAGKQVPLLLSMKEDTIALDKAIESGDVDLVYHVLLHLKKNLSLASFFRTITSRPIATAIVESSALDADRELLKDLYYQDDRRLDGSNLLVAEALDQKDPQLRVDKLKLAARLVHDSRDHSFQLKALEEAQRLLRVQDGFERDLGGPGFAGLSVNDTILKLVKQGHGKRAQKVQSEFKVPEKTFWWIRLRGLVAKRDWNELEEIGKSRKSPIGWEPFFNEILSAGNTRTAALFIPKCNTLSATDRVEMWVKCGLVVKAGEEALKAKDMNTLSELKGRASGSAVHEIERMIGQLAGGRK
ncbi:vacuolar protein-like protein sorting vps16 [Saccharata proteae CBS 121410]|uniref:Probable vacuolar protein sorting-associated protein 16 homolog n=1 Tax=Saccharata proteae CBS 121410 TaxID=1314787 RepID=A0A9P4HZ11_9PEZI|nr:vacuolar protein-like protein sorting vps16 [Saccharata proteae CBS 121410]